MMLFTHKMLAMMLAVVLLCAAQPAAAQGQKLRSEITAAQNTKRNFELDLKKYTQKNPQLERTAGKAKKDWYKNNRKRAKKKPTAQSGTSRDKNYAVLNR